MPSVHATINVTDAAVRALLHADSPKGYIVRDAKMPCLYVYIGKSTKAFQFQVERRVHGKRVAVSRWLGRFPHAKASEARDGCRILLGKVADNTIGPGKRKAVRLATAVEVHLRALRVKASSAGKASKWSDETQGYYDRHMKNQWAKRSLASLSDNPAEIAEWHAEITQRHGPSEANHAARVLRAIYQRAQRLNRTLPAMLPTSAVEWNEERRADRSIPFDKFATWATQVDAIEDDAPIRAAFHRLCVYTGMRPGELARLRWDGIDLKRRTLTVAAGKTRDIKIPMSAAIVRQLRLCRDARPAYYKGAYVFVARGASGYLQNWVERKLPLDWWGNAGRHTHRTVAASLGIDLLTCRLLQSHSVAKDVSAGYITAGELVTTSLRRAQRAISRRIEELIYERQ